MNENSKTELRLRFRIAMLLGEQDITLKQLYDRVTQLGCEVSSSHFYRHMKPYHSPMRMDLLTYVVQALHIQPSELFDLVEVSVSDDSKPPRAIDKSNVAPVKADKKAESEKVEKARTKAKLKRKEAMLGTHISLVPENKK